MENSADLFDYDKIIKKICSYLPPQGPIKDFVAQNTLGAFLDTPYEEAVKKASKLFKARSYMCLDYYREQYNKHVITKDALNNAQELLTPTSLSTEKALIRHALFNFKEICHEQTLAFLIEENQLSIEDDANLIEEIHKESSHHQPSSSSLRDLVLKKAGFKMEHHVHELLFRLLGAYLDQGISLWPFFDKKKPFLNAILELLTNSQLPLAPFVNNKELAQLLEKPKLQVIREMLAFICTEPSLFNIYIEESVLAHCGWSAMVHNLALDSSSLSLPCRIDIAQMLALKFALEWQYIKNHCRHYQAITTHEWEHQNAIHAQIKSPSTLGMVWFLRNLPSSYAKASRNFISLVNTVFLQEIWHHALEHSYYAKVFGMFDKSETVVNKDLAPLFQAVFCVDDRECSLRRWLEQINPRIETFGTAGFFGIDIFYEAPNKSLQKMCPLSMTPKHVISEKTHDLKEHFSIKDFASFMSLHGANSTILGLISSYTFGHLSLLSLMASLLHPLKWLKTKLGNNAIKYGDLLFEYSGHERPDGLTAGFTHQEMAVRVYNMLKAISLDKNFGKIVFIIGHGSSSENNPHFAAYDCGACSGKPGALNALLFALMANLKPVRELVRAMGITISDQTIFIGGYHDTCTDNVELFCENIAPDHKDLFDQFVQDLKKAREKNALERCQKFALANKNLSEKDALFEVLLRSRALFEPRPELGHATNALVIVGRRFRSKDKNLERRSFLQSYDPLSDLDGKILEGILQAVFPVCAGINLTYHFSRLDPAVYGCGTKLSHNVCGLLGVGNGLDDDLRTGLPVQMTELHIPIRILIIIEQHQHIILKTIKENNTLLPWMKNSWLRVAALAPHSNVVELYDPKSDSFMSLK